MIICKTIPTLDNIFLIKKQIPLPMESIYIIQKYI